MIEETGKLFELSQKGQFHLVQLAIICEEQTQQGEWNSIPHPVIGPLLRASSRSLSQYASALPKTTLKMEHNREWVKGIGQTLKHFQDRIDHLQKKSQSKRDSGGRHWNG